VRCFNAAALQRVSRDELWEATKVTDRRPQRASSVQRAQRGDARMRDDAEELMNARPRSWLGGGCNATIIHKLE